MEEKLYNVRVSYGGEGTFSFTIRGLGEVTIQTSRDIYLKNTDVETIEGLRQLKPLRVNITINGKPEGCFKTYDLNRSTSAVKLASRMNYDYRGTVEHNVITAEELSEIKRVATNGPIVEDDGTGLRESVETKSEDTDVNLADYVLSSTSHTGKKLSDLKKRQLSGIKKYANEADAKAIESYLETL